MTKNVAHLCSGGGTTMESAAIKANKGVLGDVRSTLMIASKPGIGAIKKAHALDDDFDIRTRICLNPNDAQELIGYIKTAGVKVIFGNGWLPRIPREVIDYCKEQDILILNQHPGSLRNNGLDFGGAEKDMGMWGTRVIAAQLMYLLETGAIDKDVYLESTIHHMTENIDEGTPVSIMRYDFPEKLDDWRNQNSISTIDEFRRLELSDDSHTVIISIRDFIKSLQEDLLEIEHKNVARVLCDIGNDKKLITPKKYFDILVLPEDKELLEKVKRQAVMMYPDG